MIIITDSDVGLTGSCEEVFPEAKKLLCQVRLRRSIRTKPLTYFGMKNKYEPLEKNTQLHDV